MGELKVLEPAIDNGLPSIHVKKRLLVVLGAGSSVEQDFPNTQELGLEIAGWAREHFERVGRASEGGHLPSQWPDYYGLLWKNRENYHSGVPDEVKGLAEHRTAPNYERVLGDLHALMNGVLGKPYGDPIYQWITKADVFKDLGIAPDGADWEDLRSGKNFHAVQGQLKALCTRLAARIRGNSVRFEIELENGRGTEAFEPYREIFLGLSQEFDLGVYNLNYDTVALNALPHAFVGFHRKNGRFVPSEVLSRPDWNFLYHLHGSVHHRIRFESRVMEDPDFGQKITWYNDLSQTGDGEDWEDAGDVAMKSDGKRVLLTSLIAGGWKLDQLQDEPFLTFYSSFVRHVHEADAILIGGYGFGDLHVNSILRNALRARSRSGRPPVIVLGHNKGGRPIANRDADPWSSAMATTLRVPVKRFRDFQHRSEAHWTNLPHKVPPGEFEQLVDANRPIPIATWNWGFNAAAPKISEIIKWLSGDLAAL